MNVGDIIHSNGQYEIVVSIGEYGIEKVNLREHIMRCHLINHNGRFINIAELVDDIMNDMINKSKV